MTKNTLGDMHNILMEQLERLNTANEDELGNEIKRSQSMANLAAAVTNNANTVMRAARLQVAARVDMPRILTAGEEHGQA